MSVGRTGLRICQITSVPLPPGEGIGYYVWNLSRFLAGEGHAVQIITRAERHKPMHEMLDGIPVWRPKFYPIYPFHVHLHGLFVQRLVRRLAGEVDLFHLHSPLPPPVHTRQPRLVTAHTTLMAQAKVIPVESLYSLLVRAQMPTSIRLEHKLFGRAAKVVAYARSVAEELGAYGLDPKQIELLGNGVDTDLFRPAERDQEARSAERYVFAAGRLDVRKGFEDLIAAMPHVISQFPGVSLYVAGAGPLAERLRARAEELGLGRMVRFLGHVGHSQMVTLFQGATLFAHAAHYEGLPGVLLEAMACGSPVACTGVSGVLDVVKDGINGLLVPPHAPEELARAICRLLGDAGLRAHLGAAARRTVEEHFSWKTVGSSYLGCYQALLNEVA